MYDVLISAHRGIHSQKLLENSALSFQIAAQIPGLHMIETDLRCSVDGHIIVNHDHDIGKMDIDKHTFAELKAEKPELIDLAELLDILAPTNLQINLHLKGSGFVAETLRFVREYNIEARTIITSSVDQDLIECRELGPLVRTGLLVNKPHLPFNNLISKLANCGADYLCPHFSLVPLFSSVVWNHGYPSIIWTVNNAEHWRRLIHKPFVYAVITDHPNQVIRYHNEKVSNLSKLQTYTLLDAPPTIHV